MGRIIHLCGVVTARKHSKHAGWLRVERLLGWVSGLVHTANNSSTLSSPNLEKLRPCLSPSMSMGLPCGPVGGHYQPPLWHCHSRHGKDRHGKQKLTQVADDGHSHHHVHHIIVPTPTNVFTGLDLNIKKGGQSRLETPIFTCKVLVWFRVYLGLA